MHPPDIPSGAGTDLVQASISYSLAANVENLTITSTAGITATGNTLANVLTSNVSGDVLVGGKGNDNASRFRNDYSFYTATPKIVNYINGIN